MSSYKVLYNFSKFVPTPDNWHPSIYIHDKMFVSGGISISFCPGEDKEYCVRVSFWGDDDDGRELELYFEDKKMAYRKYNSLKKWLDSLKSITFKTLKEKGFVNA